MYDLRFVSEANNEIESFEKREDCPRVDYLGIYTRNDEGKLDHILDFDPSMTEEDAKTIIDGMNVPLPNPIKLNCCANGEMKAKAFLAEFDALEVHPMQDLNKDLPSEEGTQLTIIDDDTVTNPHCYSLFGHLKEGGIECLHDGTVIECLILSGQLSQLSEKGDDIPKANLVLSASIMCPVCECVNHISDDDYTLLDGTNKTDCGSCGFEFKYQLELAGQTKLDLSDIDLINEAIDFLHLTTQNNRRLSIEERDFMLAKLLKRDKHSKATRNLQLELEQMYSRIFEYTGNDPHTLLLKDLSERINALAGPLLES